MNQEDRELLLKDLNARLHCRVKVTTANPAVKLGVISGISIKGNISVETKDADIVFDCTEVKPYLRPMSDMTEEEVNEFERITDNLLENGTSEEVWSTVIDWLNAHYFDYRGLIPKGITIAVTEENNPYENQNKTP